MKGINEERMDRERNEEGRKEKRTRVRIEGARRKKMKAR